MNDFEVSEANPSTLEKYVGSGGIVVIPSSIKKLGSDAFRNCDSITHVVLHTGIKYIDVCTFNNCSNLTTLVICNPNIYVCSSACADSPHLSNIYFNGTETEWHKSGLGEIAVYCDFIGLNYYFTAPIEVVTYINETGSFATIDGRLTSFGTSLNGTEMVLPDEVTEINFDSLASFGKQDSFLLG